MKAFKLVGCGIALALVVGFGPFNEATDAKLASHAWCAETCSK